MEPLVSVVIPTYNSGRYIRDAVDSVLGQTYENIEVIFIDDGSTDDTKDILQQYGSKIRYVFQNNAGPSAARNNGIKLSSGEMVAFLDADDIWMPNKLELQVALMQQYNAVGLVGCGRYTIDSSGRIIAGPFITENCKDMRALLQNIMVRPMLGTPTVLIRRECFNKVGLFDESLRGAEDWKMWIKFAKCYQIRFVEEPLVMIRVHEANTSTNVELMKSCAMKIVRSGLYRGEYLLSAKARSRIYMAAARDYLGVGNKHSAFINALRSIMTYPLRTYNMDRKYLILALSVIPPWVIDFFRKTRVKQ